MPLPTWLVLFVSALVGLLTGSFLATAVLRIPKRQPIVWARSACPACGHLLAPRELVPLVSWLVQSGRCRACAAPISVFYPVMEIASALIAVAGAWWMPWPDFLGFWFAGWAALCLAAWLVRERRFVKRS
jgi:prepilin signal peptidase PulO-like enzyme (type II secretory pathway)